MSESKEIRHLRDQVSLLRAEAENAHVAYRQSIRDLDKALEEQPPAPKGYHEDSQHVWRKAERNPALLARLEVCSCGASRTVQL